MLEQEVLLYANVMSADPDFYLCPHHAVEFGGQCYDVDHPILIRQNDRDQTIITADDGGWARRRAMSMPRKTSPST
jgi:hypothetical protein